MLKHYLDELVVSSKNIVLLQGPLGHFFKDLSRWLEQQNKSVYKINFNGGDEYFYIKNHKNTINYQQSIQDWECFLVHFIKQNHIDSILCFGDHRPYHKIAKRICEKYGIQFWVFEEGYFRPHYVTLEKQGVNAFSPIPKNAEFFLENHYQDLPEPIEPKPLAKGFLPMAENAMKYYFAAFYKQKKYPHYQHHKELALSYYIRLWITSGIKRLYYYFQDRQFAKQVNKNKFAPFFIVPLQVYDDSQVKVHCDFENVEHFLREVLISFATHAPENVNLIVKHHPMDRGFIDYTKIINNICSQYPTIKERVFYVHDVPMPVFLRKAKGMVTLNSTSGLSALLHHVPTITLGRANYDIAGLTYQGTLANFWQNPTPPNTELFEAYRKFHLYKTQINGSFYTKVNLPTEFRH